MAVNKRKLLASAQKHLTKGSLDKALRDYTAILEADPRDANVRLKVGDLHLRRGDRDQAVAAYRKVADQFMRDGFDAKAVALYKQITKIDPKRFDVYVPLAELYQRLGLTGDAMSALQTAADALHREGRKHEALELLRRMAGLDPSNTTTRLKVAELLRQAGLEAEAAAEYEEAARELGRQGDWESQLAVLERVLELLPEHAPSLEAIARTLTERGRADRAEPFARRLVGVAGEKPESHEVLASVLAALDRKEEAVGAYRALADLYRARGDEDRARDILQRHVLSEAIEVGGAEEAFGDNFLETGAPPPMPEPESAAAPAPPAAERTPPAGPTAAVAEPEDDAGYLEETDPGSAAAEPAPAPAPAAAPVELPEDMDADQVVAEATVYLRYGKHDRAIATLEAVLAREPEHGGALVKLGEAYATAGDAVRAVSSYVRAADLASQSGDADRFDAIHARIAELDPEAAEEIASLSPRVPGTPPSTDASVLDDALGLDEIDIEIEGAEVPPGEAGAAPEPVPAPELELDTGAGSGEIEIELAGDAAGEAQEPPQTGAGEAPPAAVAPAGDDLERLLESTSFSDATAFEPPAPEAAAPEAVPPAPEPVEPAALEGDAGAGEGEALEEAPAAAPALDPEQLADQLDEARFYFDQGLLDEAEAIYQRIVRLDPAHEEAVRRLAEIEAARAGGAPVDGAEAARPADAPGVGDATRALTEALGPPEDLDAAFETQPGMAAAPEHEGADPMARTVADLGGHTLLGMAPPADLTSPSQTLAMPGLVAAEEPPEDFARVAPEVPDAALAGLAPGAPDAPPAEDASDAPDTPLSAGGAGALDSPLLSDTAPELEPAGPPAEASPEPAAAPEPEPVQRSAGPAEAAPERASAADAAPAEEGSFDLAAALSGVFDDAGAPASEEEAFDAIFQEFKEGVSRTLDEGDVETRYDLGIAYREMGLFEDAIAEFGHVLDSPDRRLDALHMLALCALDLGRPQDAVGHLEQALATPELAADREVPLRYDLGRAYEQHGDEARALDAFRRVAAMDPDFQDVAACLRRLEGSVTPAAAPAADTGAETYESFDDLLEAAEAEAAPGGAADPQPPAAGPDAREAGEDLARVELAEAGPAHGERAEAEQVAADGELVVEADVADDLAGLEVQPAEVCPDGPPEEAAPADAPAAGADAAAELLAALEAEDARATAPPGRPEGDAPPVAGSAPGAAGASEDTEPELPPGFDADALASDFEELGSRPTPAADAEIMLEEVTDSGLENVAPEVHPPAAEPVAEPAQEREAPAAGPSEDAATRAPEPAAPAPPPASAVPQAEETATPAAAGTAADARESPPAPVGGAPAAAAGDAAPQSNDAPSPAEPPGEAASSEPAPPEPPAPRRRKRKISFV